MEHKLVSAEVVDSPAPRPGGPSRAAPAVDLSVVLPVIPMIKTETVASLDTEYVTLPEDIAETPSVPQIIVSGAGLPVDSSVDFFPDQMDVPHAMSLTCEPSLSVSPQIGALLQIEFRAPCDANAAVVVSHAGLRFSSQTDDYGALALEMPALRDDALISITLPDGRAIEGGAEVPEVQHYDRVVLQWAGDANLSIHAMEYGATYGGDGHVFNMNPKSPLRSIDGRGGYLMRLGESFPEAALFAEIYSFPSQIADRQGVVRLAVEAGVTEITCGQRVSAQTLQTLREGEINTVNLTFEMPGCDAIGDILLLKNVLQDLKIALN